MLQILICLLFSCSLFAAGPVRLDRPEMKTVSVVIPCAGSHFKYLDGLLELFSGQTVRPDEIVVSLSSVEKLEAGQMDELEVKEWPFRLVLLRSKGKQSAGLNRNLAVAQVTGDVVIFQDADDVPHPQRVEIVKYLFEHYALDHLMHKFITQGQMFGMYDPEEVSVSHFDTYNELDHTAPFNENLHNGNVACTREVAKEVPWVDVKRLDCDQDVRFNRDVYAKFSRTGAIVCELVMWRWQYSAFNPKNNQIF